MKDKPIILFAIGLSVVVFLTAAVAPFFNVTIDASGVLRSISTNIFSANAALLNGAVSGVNTSQLSGAAYSALVSRANHTGTQPISTVSGLQTALDERQRTNAVLTALQGLTSGSAGQIVTATGAGTFAMSNAPSSGSSISVNSVGAITNIADSAEISNTVTSGSVYHGLKTSGVTSGTYTNPVITFDSKGRATSAANGPEAMFGERSQFRMWDDMLGVSTSVGDDGTSGVGGGGSVIVTAVDPAHPGMKSLRSSSSTAHPLWGWLNTTTFQMTNSTGTAQYYFETMVKTPVSMSGAGGTDIYRLESGFNNQVTGATTEPTDGSYFSYCTNLLSAQNWAFNTRANSSAATVIDTGVAVTASTWYRLGVYMDATNTYGYINGNIVATNTTQIPLSRNMGVVNRIVRTNGTTTLDYVVDYMLFQGKGLNR